MDLFNSILSRIMPPMTPKRAGCFIMTARMLQRELQEHQMIAAAFFLGTVMAFGGMLIQS